MESHASNTKLSSKLSHANGKAERKLRFNTVSKLSRSHMHASSYCELQDPGTAGVTPIAKPDFTLAFANSKTKSVNISPELLAQRFSVCRVFGRHGISMLSAEKLVHCSSKLIDDIFSKHGALALLESSLLCISSH